MSYVNQFEKKEVGQKIRAIREANKMSHGDFAKAFGVNVKLVREWEKGVNLPNPKKLDKILNFKPNKKPASKTQEKKKIKSRVCDKKKAHIVTDEQLEEIKQNAYNRASARIVESMFSLPLIALEDEGFGQKRLNRVADRMLELLIEAIEDSNKLKEYQIHLASKYYIATVVSEDFKRIERVNEMEVKRWLEKQ